MCVTNEEELGKAIAEEEETIEIKGALAPKISKMKSLNATLWAICIGLLAIVIIALLAAPTTVGMSMAAGFVAGTPAAGILGVPAAASAVLVAVAGGGVTALSRIRDYRLEKISKYHIVLYRGK